MRRLAIWLLRLALGLVVVLGLLWLVLPREPVDTVIEFDPATIGPDLDAYLATREADVPDLVPGTEKRVIWAGAPGERTPLSVLYIHGFSATSEEIRPVPDRVAEGLGANLVFWRLSGHGRDGAAMAEPSAGDWIEDTAEALAVARAAGDEVLLIATSTGGTLAAIAAADPALSEGIVGIVLVSPNFGLAHPAGQLLSLPGVRWWGPLIAGEERGFQPVNAANERYWTTRYPTVSAVPMAALVDYAKALDYGAATVPLLVLYSEEDRVVSPDTTREIAARWAGPATLAPQVLGEGDDAYDHVLAGDILSPGMTDDVVAEVLDWASGL